MGLVLGMYGGSRKEFLKAQERSPRGEENILDELMHGLYLGSQEFGEECIRRLQREGYREKPQGKSLLRGRDVQALALEILGKLGERDSESVFRVRKYRCWNRDMAIYILYQLGVYRNEEIGKVFGVGYTAVTGAVKRALIYLNKDQRLKRITKKIIDDI
jgi:hypothetical protein